MRSDKIIGKLAQSLRRPDMSTHVEDLYQRIQALALTEKLELVSRVFADLKANLELQEELADWDRLSDEALELLDKEP